MSKTIRILGFVLLLGAQAWAEPIKRHPSNPHYYLFNGRPTILITSAEHYGAVVNLDFDYVAYLDALKANGMNYTREWPGAILEMVGEFCKDNTMGPRPDRTIVPWARSNEPECVYGGNKYDLDKWNPEFFERLKDFIVKAGERGIVVEICFFNAQRSYRWPLSPLYHENNVQGVGKCDFEDFQTLKDADLVRRQSEYVRKITQEVNAYDNVILEVCDEPAAFTPPAEAGPWVGRLLDVVHNTESQLPNKHLIAQEVQGGIGGPIDFGGNPALSIIVGQYVWGSERQNAEMGGIKGLDYEYGHNKPIEFNETAYYPFQYRRGDPLLASRVEAWEFIVGGGASFNQLNSRYAIEDPAGKTPDNAQILSALRNLKNFIYSFDFIKMHPDTNFVVSGIPSGTYCRGISQPGAQYALYHHHSVLEESKSSYVVTPGKYAETLVLNLPGGAYQADWIDPASGSIVGSLRFTHQGGDKDLITPEHTVDIALRIKRIH